MVIHLSGMQGHMQARQAFNQTERITDLCSQLVGNTDQIDLLNLTMRDTRPVSSSDRTDGHRSVRNRVLNAEGVFRSAFMFYSVLPP